ncbi:MAG: ribonuclease III [Nitrospinota bacterium]
MPSSALKARPKRRRPQAAAPRPPSPSVLQARLGYTFRRPALLELALTHRSFGREGGDGTDNERLEFLGDAALGLILAERLFREDPRADEGELSRRRAHRVSRSFLASLARWLDLGEHLRLGRGEAASGGRKKSSILAGALEAVVGAIFVDGGFGACRKVVRRLFAESEKTLLPPSDYKSLLQERSQEASLGIPLYRTVRERGPEHRKTFEVEVLLAEKGFGRGRGESKKAAEQAAAKAALGALGGKRRKKRSRRRTPGGEPAASR